MSNRSYIIAAKRSAVAPRDGALSGLNLHELSSPIIKALLSECDLGYEQIDELIVGNALGAGGNPARLIALASGLPERVAGLSIDRQCCSGLDSIMIANDMIASGRASIVIAGGVESYSNRPKRLHKTGGDAQWQEYDQPAFTPWPERDPNMSMAAHALSENLGIGIDKQNAWTVQSHHAAMQARSRLKNEIITLDNTDIDTFTRSLSLKTCERAKPIHGSISVANTSVAADGAAFCVVVSEAVAKQFKGTKCCVRAGSTLGSNPELPGLAPVAAIDDVLANEGIKTTDLHRAEIMEAYAVQAIACIEQTNLDVRICNVGGGSLARGHPIGASGAILMTRLFHELKQTLQSEQRTKESALGLAAIAAAGGLGTAVLVEAVR